MITLHAIRTLATTAAQLGLDRDALLGGIDLRLVSTMPIERTPLSQYLSDLHFLTQATMLTDGTIPLHQWLGNAVICSRPRPETSIFEDALSLSLSTPANLEGSHSSAPVAAAQYRSDYLNHVALKYDIFNDNTLATRMPFRVALRDVVVQLRLVDTPISAARINPVELVEYRRSRTIFDFIELARHTRGIGLVVLGAAGSGKSTLVHHLAVQLASTGLTAPQALVPIVLPLRAHARTILTNPRQTIADLAGLAEGAQSPPVSWFRARLLSGEVLVLVDGLDEVPDGAGRDQVAAWIDCQITAFPSSLFLVTSRPGGYREHPLRAHEVEILPFTSDQIERFITAWFRAHVSRKQDRAEAARFSKNAAKRLMQRILSDRELLQLATNPLLLTMMVGVHSVRNELPAGRAELYRDIADISLGYWREPRSSADDRSPKVALRTALRTLAVLMSGERILEASLQQVLNVFRPLVLAGAPGRVVHEGFLKDDVETQSGLLIEAQHGKWSFCHRSFQEYLTAEAWHMSERPPDCATLAGDSWWNGSLRFLAALCGGTRVVTACWRIALDANFDLLETLFQESCIGESLRSGIVGEVDDEIRLLQLDTDMFLDKHLIERQERRARLERLKKIIEARS